ncbi:DEAD/DEAH box helicase [Carpediemonas membranifera]|uniref:ATP-dependent RNA helicase n=1 Tax=Carpediemonas membranifera TaxID=201153 RepID=A0A8J6BXJ8_9EUKA|nr:DEAD/DEAH box helicase [Carpediemonas membranifera]|eukprot:KAG9393561.1 DEAD/DEAH box helicase [Carpediemonas membranifera]
MGQRQKVKAQKRLSKPIEKREKTGKKKPAPKAGTQFVEFNEASWRPAEVFATAEDFMSCNEEGLMSFEVLNPADGAADVPADLDQYTFMDGDEFEASDDEQRPKKAKKGKQAVQLEPSPVADSHGQSDEAWRALGLHPALAAGLVAMGFEKPLEVQRQAIPHTLAGKHVFGAASTGSGKTLAFVLPVLDAILKQGLSADKGPIATVFAPSRELAAQIESVISSVVTAVHSTTPSVGRYFATSCRIVGGEADVKQLRALTKYPPHIIIATPGRLADLIETRSDVTALAMLPAARFVVFDEADKLLSGSASAFPETDVGRLVERVQACPGHRQVSAFSATMTMGATGRRNKKAKDAVSTLRARLPVRTVTMVDLTGDARTSDAAQLAPGLHLTKIKCASDADKLGYLLYIVYRHRVCDNLGLAGGEYCTPDGRIVVFVNSLATCNHLATALKELSIPVYQLYGDMAQKARYGALEKFKAAPGGSVLVAVDVAARGIDDPGIDTVIHYHLPDSAETFAHRSGRAGRAHAKGLVVALVNINGNDRTEFGTIVSGLRAKAVKELDVDSMLMPSVRQLGDMASELAKRLLAKSADGRGRRFERKAKAALDVDEADIDEATAVREARLDSTNRAAVIELRRVLSKTKLRPVNAKTLTSNPAARRALKQMTTAPTK